MNMVTISLATLENQLPLFIKSVLDANLVDTVTRTTPNQFVYKDAPIKPATQYPYIIVELSNSTTNQMSYDGYLRLQRDITLSIRIVSKGQGATATRDTLTDSILTILFSPASTDVSGASMNDNLLEVLNCRTSPTLYFSKDGDVIKMKELTCNLRYRGA